MAKSKLKILARILRREKKSIKSIAKELGVSVSSVSVWCRDISFSTEEKKELIKKGYYAGTEARLQAIKRRRDDLDSKIKNIHLKAASTVGNLTQRELLIAGSALYWGEGFKKDRLVGLASMSPHIAQFYLKWLHDCFDIKTKDLLIRVTINKSYIQHIDKITHFWSRELGISIKQFAKPYYQQTKQKKIYENASTYHGVIRIKVRKSVHILRQIEGLIIGLSIYSLGSKK